MTTNINAALALDTPSPPPPPPQPSALQAKSLGLSAKPKRVDTGGRTRLTAVLAPCNAGTQGDVIDFYRGAKKIASKVADSACKAVRKVKMRKTSRFKAVSPADGNSLAATSNTAKVRVVG